MVELRAHEIVAGMMARAAEIVVKVTGSRTGKVSGWYSVPFGVKSAPGVVARADARDDEADQQGRMERAPTKDGRSPLLDRTFSDRPNRKFLDQTGNQAARLADLGSLLSWAY